MVYPPKDGHPSHTNRARRRLTSFMRRTTLATTPRRTLQDFGRGCPTPRLFGSSIKPGIERVQALADILRSALCCHGNQTRAPIANPPNSAQLEGTRYHSPNLHPGPCSSVGMRRGGQTHTDGHDQYNFSSATPHAKCNRIM